MSLQWNGNEIMVELNKAVGAGTRAAAITLQAAVRESLNRQGTPTSKTGFAQLSLGRSIIKAAGKSIIQLALSPARTRSRASRRAVDLAASVESLGGLVDPAGGRPRKRTGTLQRGIDFEMDQDDALVGSAVEYARIHEFGGTIQHPGGTPYRFIAGRILFLRKITGAGKNTNVTKPHLIRIPARPYFRPAVLASAPKMTENFVAAARQSLGGGE